MALIDQLATFELSTVTLLVFFAVPFSYYIYNAKFRGREDLLKRADLLLKIVAAVLGVLILLKVGLYSRHAALEYRLLGFLHLAPLLLTFLNISHCRHLRVAGAAQQALPDGENGYRPQPINSDIEKIGWDELVISSSLKSELLSVINLLKDPPTARRYGIDVPKGILFQGPPGTGKTSIAKVVANTAGLSFFALRLDEVVSKWVGESEKNLSRLFDAARRHVPAVIFIDEVDAIGKARSGTGWSDNLLNHLLQLIDGVVRTDGLYIIAATNRPEMVDEALKRPGRLNKVIQIPLPDFDSRKEIFRRSLAKLPMAGEIDVDFLAGSTVGRSGAVIKQICNQAGLNAFQRESREGRGKREYRVKPADIDDAVYQFAGAEEDAPAVKVHG